MEERRRGRPKKADTDKRETAIIVRLTSDEKETLKRISQFSGDNYSTIFRKGMEEMKRKMDNEIFEIMN